MLENDRHFAGIFLLQPLRESDTGGLCLEGDVEVMIARQAEFCRLLQNGAHDAAHGFLRQGLVVDRLLGRHLVSRNLIILRPARQRCAKN